jgi:hypothetical protein
MTDLNPQQQDFKRFYLDPESSTYGNAKASALKARFSESYADNLTSLEPEWLSEIIGKGNRSRMVKKAEKKLEEFITHDQPNIALDATKFVLKTAGKEHYSERSEVTGKDGEKLFQGLTEEDQAKLDLLLK